MSSSEPTNWAEHPDLVAFYADHRNQPEHLYPSERRFLPWLAQQSASILDVGCAAGGFSNIWRHYQPTIVYTGVDLSAGLVNAARKFHPDLQFHQGNCAEGLALPDGSADVVAAIGWLHWEPQYESAIRELWRLTDRFCFFDVRLVTDRKHATRGRQQVAFVSDWDGQTTTPYVTVYWDSFAEQLLSLQPKSIMGQGYWGQAADTVMDIESQVCFAAFVLEKSAAAESPQLPMVCCDLPFNWPDHLPQQVDLHAGAELANLIPQL
jgi:SAM-dependent methyltransferase